MVVPTAQPVSSVVMLEFSHSILIPV